MNKHNEISAGFGWRSADRATKRGNWLRDLAIALAIALAASLLGMIGNAYAQRSIQISGTNRTATVLVPIGKSQDVPRIPASSMSSSEIRKSPMSIRSPTTRCRFSASTTRVSVYNEGKKLVGIFDVEVSYDITRLTNELKRRFPGSRIQASTVNGRIMLSGEVADAATLDKAVTIARQFGPDIINSVSVSSPQQVLQPEGRPAGEDTCRRFAGDCGGRHGQIVGRYAVADIGDALAAEAVPMRIIASGVTTDVMINALEEKGIARSLAEPNLVALSGDTAMRNLFFRVGTDDLSPQWRSRARPAAILAKFSKTFRR